MTAHDNCINRTELVAELHRLANMSEELDDTRAAPDVYRRFANILENGWLPPNSEKTKEALEEPRNITAELGEGLIAAGTFLRKLDVANSKTVKDTLNKFFS